MVRSLLAALPKAAPDFQAGGPEAHASLPVPLPNGAGAAVPTPSVQMLVALAAANPAIERRRKEAAKADRGLDLLERLHGELLAGVATPARLREVADWAQTMDTPEDPVLAAIVRDIDLRVRVELAKYDVEV